MTKLKLMQIANEAYPDGFIANYFNSKTGDHTKHHKGDSLAYFIASELDETFNPEATKEEQLNEAIRVMTNARDDLQLVIDHLRENK